MQLKLILDMAIITEAIFNHIRSLTLGEDLMDAGNMIEHKKYRS
jgi:aspartate 1-decarboxylase